MKKMISKIMLAALVVGSVPMHASLGQTVRNGARTVLQGAGNNAGYLALAAGALGALWASYKLHKMDCDDNRAITSYERALDEGQTLSPYRKSRLAELKNKNRAMFPLVTVLASSIIAGSAYLFAKACGWVGSKI